MTSTSLILLAPLALAGALVCLAMYLRGGPPTAHGYAIKGAPRRRREVASWVLTLLWPLFTYNEHRRAYVLRVVGTRRGPVLRRRRDPDEIASDPLRTGRFERVEPALDDPVLAEAAPRAPVGARGRPPPGKRAKSKDVEPED